MSLIEITLIMVAFMTTIFLGILSWNKPAAVRVRVDRRNNPNRLR